MNLNDDIQTKLFVTKLKKAIASKTYINTDYYYY